LQRAKVPIVTDERTSLMHNKFMVIDSRAVWTGSWNFTANDTFRNNNHAILLHSGELAQNFSAEFAEMFEQKQFGPTSPINTPHPRIIRGETLIESCFAPEDRCADQIIRLVRQAQRTIRFMAFSFTHDGIGKAIRDRANDGIRVEGVFESRGSDVASSEYESLRRKKLDIWLDGNPYTMHHKIIIIDNQTVILGSFNFSDSANEANDENMLAIHDRAVTEAYLAEFDRVYRQAQAP
jgi:phosphatidylserine/phosphatidylglycerophosphate/cardiolipin synthase-like enzyme